MNELDDFYRRIGSDVCVEDEAPPPDTSRIPIPGWELNKPPFLGSISNPRWSRSDDVYWSASETCERLDAGFYRCEARPQIGPCVNKLRVPTDKLVPLPDTAGDEVIKEFIEFWTLKHRFEDRGLIHKRGVLLWGPAGSGKTASLMLMANTIITAHDGIVVQVDHPYVAASCLQCIRKIEPERPIVALVEDLDALVQQNGETGYLALLDGELQINSIVYIATTNYPERLDRRFVDRPSRFDIVRWIGMPSAAARRIYLKAKDPSLGCDELEKWVACTEGFSIAHLRELVILVSCFGRSLVDAIARLDSMRLDKPSSEHAPDRPRFGIHGLHQPQYPGNGKEQPDLY